MKLINSHATALLQFRGREKFWLLNFLFVNFDACIFIDRHRLILYNFLLLLLLCEYIILKFGNRSCGSCRYYFRNIRLCLCLSKMYWRPSEWALGASGTFTYCLSCLIIHQKPLTLMYDVNHLIRKLCLVIVLHFDQVNFLDWNGNMENNL